MGEKKIEKYTFLYFIDIPSTILGLWCFYRFEFYYFRGIVNAKEETEIYVQTGKSIG